MRAPDYSNGGWDGPKVGETVGVRVPPKFDQTVGAVSFGNVDDLDFARSVFKEVARARAKFPGNSLMFAALVEEVGELARALLERDRKLATDDAVWAEATQVAAMAARLAVEGSAEFEYRTKKL